MERLINRILGAGFCPPLAVGTGVRWVAAGLLATAQGTLAQGYPERGKKLLHWASSQVRASGPKAGEGARRGRKNVAIDYFYY